jgi:hypothetical protein
MGADIQPTVTDPPPPTLDGPDGSVATNTTNNTAAVEPAKDDGEQLGTGGKKALDAERKARRDAEAKLKELEPLAKAAQEKADAEKSELQKVNEALAGERDARTKAEGALLRYTVAADKGVPTKLAQFLSGTTKEEVEASADTLLAELGNGDRPQIPGKPTERLVSGKPSSTLDNDDPMALIRKARRLDET